MKLDHALKATSAILKGTTFCINNNNYKNSYLYLRSNDKTNFALLRNIDESKLMNLSLNFNKSDSKFNIQFDDKIVLNVENNKVGINTATPSTNLDVVGSGMFSENLSVNGDLNILGKLTGFNVDSRDDNSAINVKYLNDFLVKHYYNMQGPVGPQGRVGPTGSVGPQGVQGIKGDKGDKGNQGNQGLPGLTGPKGEKGDSTFNGEGLPGPTGPQGVTGPAGPKGDSNLTFNGSIVFSYKLLNQDITITSVDTPMYIIDNSKKFTVDLLSSTDGLIVKIMNMYINKDVVQNVYLTSSDSIIYNLNKKKVILPTTDMYDTVTSTTKNPLSENASITLMYLNLTNNPGWYVIDQSPVNFYYPERILYDSEGNPTFIQDW